MKYAKITLQYLFSIERGKRFVLLFLIALPLALFAAFVTPFDNYIAYFANYTTGGATFAEVWTTNVVGNTSSLLMLFSLVLAPTVFSCAASVVARSIRVGSFYLMRITSEINDNFYPALISVAGFALVFSLLKVLYVAFAVSLRFIQNYVLSITLSAVLTAVFYFAVIVFASMMLLWTPLMTFRGARPTLALQQTFAKTARPLFKIVFALALAVLFLVGVNICASLLGDALQYLLNALGFGAFFAYIGVLPFVVYADIEQLKREDYTRDFLLRKQ